MENLKTVVYQRLEAIAAAEKITRVELAALSREALIYVPDTDDIDLVNRLLGVLTPMNRRVAILFFSHFIPHEVEKDPDGNFSRFGKKLKGDKKYAAKLALIKEFLADESNTIWTWSDENIELKKKDLFGPIGKAINKALAGDEKTDTPALSPIEVVNAIFGSDLTMDQMLAGIEAMRIAEQETLAKEEAIAKAVAQIEAQYAQAA